MFCIAAAFGTLHAAWSFYWALGGTLLLETVGQWAAESIAETPGLAFAGLAFVGLVKLLGAWVPLLAETGKLPWRGLWRRLGWAGGPFLILYGGANVLAGSAVLLGFLEVSDTDTTGLIGHTFIWGPHFALWGIALTLGLMFSHGATRKQS